MNASRLSLVVSALSIAALASAQDITETGNSWQGIVYGANASFAYGGSAIAQFDNPISGTNMTQHDWINYGRSTTVMQRGTGDGGAFTNEYASFVSNGNILLDNLGMNFNGRLINAGGLPTAPDVESNVYVYAYLWEVADTDNDQDRKFDIGKDNLIGPGINLGQLWEGHMTDQGYVDVNVNRTFPNVSFVLSPGVVYAFQITVQDDTIINGGFNNSIPSVSSTIEFDGGRGADLRFTTQSLPEPAPFVAFGLGSAFLLVRRVRKAK